jgi:hypothetical protein
MAEFLSANQSHFVLIIASGLMLGLAVAGIFRGGISLSHNPKPALKTAGYAVMLLSFIFGAWIVVTTMAGY